MTRESIMQNIASLAGDLVWFIALVWLVFILKGY